MLRMLYGLVFVLLVAVTLCNGTPSPKYYLVETKDEGTALEYRGRSDDVDEGTDYRNYRQQSQPTGNSNGNSHGKPVTISPYIKRIMG